jgi:hypothetical protein
LSSCVGRTDSLIKIYLVGLRGVTLL